MFEDLLLLPFVLWKLFSSLTFLNSAWCNSSPYFHSSFYYLLPYLSIPIFSFCLLHLVSIFFCSSLFFIFTCCIVFSSFFCTLLLLHFFLRFSSISLIFFYCSSSPSFPLLLSVLLRYSPPRSTSSLLNTVLHPSPIRSETPSSRIAAASSAYRSHDIT